MTNKTTIENVNGVPHTVVWYVTQITDNPFDCEFNASDFVGLDKLNTYRGYDSSGNIEWIALSPLPRNPTADDAKLILLYQASGLYICATENYSEPEENRNPFIIVGSNNEGCFYYQEIINKHEDGWLDPSIITITHVINEQGERVEVAIIDRDKL